MYERKLAEIKALEARLAEVEADCRDLHKMASDGCAAALVTAARLADAEALLREARVIANANGYVELVARIDAFHARVSQ